MKIVKENINFEKPNSEEEFRGRLFPKWYVSIIDFTDDQIIQVLKEYNTKEKALNYYEDFTKREQENLGNAGLDVMIQKSYLPLDEYINRFNGIIENEE